MTFAEIGSWVFGVPFVLSLVGWFGVMGIAMWGENFDRLFDRYFGKMFAFVILFGILFGGFALWSSIQQEKGKQSGCEQIGGHYVVVGHYQYSIKGVVYTGDNYGCVK